MLMIHPRPDALRCGNADLHMSHINTHAHKCIHTHTRMQAGRHACMHARTHAPMHACMHACTLTCTCSHVHMHRRLGTSRSCRHQSPSLLDPHVYVRARVSVRVCMSACEQATVRGSERACVRASVRACVRAIVRAGVRVCTRTRMCVCAGVRGLCGCFAWCLSHEPAAVVAYSP